MARADFAGARAGTAHQRPCRHRVRPRVTGIPAAVVAVVAALVPWVAVAADPGEHDAPLGWTLDARGEVSDADGHALSAAAAFEPKDAGFGGGITLLRADGATGGAGASGSATAALESIAARAAYRRGTLRYEAGFERTDDEDLRTSNELRGSLGVALGAWDATFELSHRRTTFDPVSLVAPVTLRDGRTITIGGTADCDVDDTGYALSLGWSGDRWSAYVDGSIRDYDALSCAYSSAAPAELQRLAPRLFRAIADAQSVRVGRLATGLLAPQAALLDSSYGVGLARSMGPLIAALDVWRGDEAFTGAQTDAWTVTLTWLPTRTLAIELGGGVSTYEDDDTPFATVGVRVSL